MTVNAQPLFCCFSAPQTRDALHPSLPVVRGASRLGHLEKMSKICPVSKLPVHISLIFSGVLNSYILCKVYPIRPVPATADSFTARSRSMFRPAGIDRLETSNNIS